MQGVMCDTSIFVALWKPDEEERHRYFSQDFIDKAVACTYYVNVSEFTREEIRKRFEDYMTQNYLEELNHFFNLKKLTEFNCPEDEAAYKKFKDEVNSLIKKAKSADYDLSWVDAVIVYIAKKNHLPLISWDLPMIDFANEEGVSAQTPESLN